MAIKLSFLRPPVWHVYYVEIIYDIVKFANIYEKKVEESVSAIIIPAIEISEAKIIIFKALNPNMQSGTPRNR